MSAPYVFSFAVADVIQFTREIDCHGDAEAVDFAARALEHQLAVRHPDAVAATMQVDRADGERLRKLGLWSWTPNTGKVWCKQPPAR